MTHKILIANRGEIAVRIIRTCREMGIKTVAVYSDIDRAALHVRMADEAYLLGGASASESYLNSDKIISAAKKSGATAIHPGYGFLSENPDFADLCRKEKIIFIGPSPKTMKASGDKLAARALAKKAGVASVPGDTRILKNAEEAQIIAEKIGYPVMLKAKAGGGGKGMRLVSSASEMEKSFRLASSEATQSFKDPSLYLEKYIEEPHHVEVQILGDEKGKIICLGERDCSVQRRHQKIIEESPSPFISEKTRQKMFKAALKLAHAAKYTGAGTVEFLVDAKQNFYFLEINARLQVEHPVTEMVTGLDLVRAQIEVANGERVERVASGACPPPDCNAVKPAGGHPRDRTRSTGHSLECRIYAEDPEHNFIPSPGKITGLRLPSGPYVRVDTAVYEGCEIPIHYDPLIAKLITWGRNRQEAIQRMSRALDEFEVVGIKTNITFHQRVMREKDFVAGRYDTGFVGKMNERVASGACSPPDCNVVKPAGGHPRDRTRSLQAIAGIAAKLAAERDADVPPLLNKEGDGGRSVWKRTARTEGIE